MVTVAASSAAPRRGPSAAEHGELLALTDARPMVDLLDARARVARVAEILAGRADARGVFPLIYGIGLDAVVAARAEGRFRDPAWVERFDVAFVRRYLDGLHRHLRGEEPMAAWRAMYVRIDAGAASIAGTVADALNAHLINDLPEALHESRVRAYHVLDYQRLSSLIWRTAPAALSAIREAYGVDLAPLLDAGVLTWPVDALAGRPAATQEQLFFAVTRSGFAHGLALVNPLARPVVRAQIAGQWRALAVVAATFAPPTG